MRDDRGLVDALLSDGRLLLTLTAFVLALCGGFAIFQSWTGYFLPQDVHALGFDAQALARAANPQVVRFMFHDRVAFGGTLLGIGVIYWFLAEFPLRAREAWAWWALCLSGSCGFLSFLTYLGYGYLDDWHGVATLCLLPVFLAGLWRARPARVDWRDAVGHGQPWSLGRVGLGFLAAGILAAGVTIMIVGMTRVFVPQDLAFMCTTRAELERVSARLVPVIAHDRAGFGGGLFSIGVLLLFLVRHAPLTRSFVQTVGAVGVAGFGTAIGVHPAIGYTDFVHLAPAYAGGLVFLATVVRLARERSQLERSGGSNFVVTAGSTSESSSAAGSTAASPRRTRRPG